MDDFFDTIANSDGFEELLDELSKYEWERDLERDLVLDRWDHVPEVSKCLQKDDIQSLIDSLPNEKRMAVIVLMNYIMSHLTSSLKMVVAGYESDNDKIILLTIPAQRIGIDLSHNTKNELLWEGYELKHIVLSDLYKELMRFYVNKEDDYNEYPCSENSWTYYALNEVVIKPTGQNEYFLAKSFTDKIENVIINQGDFFPIRNSNLVDNPFSSFVLNTLFKNESNWEVCQSYSQIKHLDKCWFPYHAICYEKRSYVDVEGCYCIENTVQLDAKTIDDLTREKEIYIFACEDSPSVSQRIEFLGVYKLDLGKSKEKGYLTFHLQKYYNVELYKDCF